MSRNHTSVAEILKDVLPPARRKRIFSLGLVRLKWGAVVGRELALRSEPVSLEGGLLTVRVLDAVWGRMILKLERNILPRIGKIVELGLVRRIQFIRDGVPPWKKEALPEGPESSRRIAAETDKLPEPIVEAARAVSDHELRSLLTRTASRYLAAQAARRR